MLRIAFLITCLGGLGLAFAFDVPDAYAEVKEQKGSGFPSCAGMDGRWDERDETILDRCTGLEWRKKAPPGEFTVKEAQEFLKAWRQGERWRLPTADEGFTILRPSKPLWKGFPEKMLTSTAVPIDDPNVKGLQGRIAQASEDMNKVRRRQRAAKTRAERARSAYNVLRFTNKAKASDALARYQRYEGEAKNASREYSRAKKRQRDLKKDLKERRSAESPYVYQLYVHEKWRGVSRVSRTTRGTVLVVRTPLKGKVRRKKYVPATPIK